MAEKHCKLCVDCIHHGTCFREGNKKAYNGVLDISGCKYYKSAVNFVEVVRCKDCTHSQYSKGHGYICEYDNKCRHGMNYCSEGDPREDSIDVVEVVHARWIDHKNGNATCSHCRIRQTAVYDDDNEQNFCGHCGAKMDGGAE